MPEAITKYAVNSTLGTNHFMSLDEIISNQHVMYSSNNLHRMLFSGNTQIFELARGTSETKTIQEFTAICKGTCTIKLKVTSNRGTTDGVNGEFTTTVSIKKNGSVIRSQDATSRVIEKDFDLAAELSFANLSFKYGDKFSIDISTTNSSARTYYVYYGNLGIYGDVTTGIFNID